MSFFGDMYKRRADMIISAEENEPGGSDDLTCTFLDGRPWALGLIKSDVERDEDIEKHDHGCPHRGSMQYY